MHRNKGHELYISNLTAILSDKKLVQYFKYNKSGPYSPLYYSTKNGSTSEGFIQVYELVVVYSLVVRLGDHNPSNARVYIFSTTIYKSTDCFSPK